MKKLNVLISLSTDASDFQREQAKAANETASRLGAEIKIVYAQNDAIVQSEQLLQAIQGEHEARPNAIIVQPCGSTPLPHVARAANAASIGWVVLNWTPDYIAELRAKPGIPAFAVSSDQQEIGRIQGRQLAALLPDGGSAIYIQGPSSSPAAKQRAEGMNETRPANVRLRQLKSNSWSEEDGGKAVTTWLRLSTSQKERFDAIVAQNDLLAVGARNALVQQLEQGGGVDHKMLHELSVTGVDGLPRGGQLWVQKGLLAATVVVPTNADTGLELLVQALKTGAQPPEITYTVPISYPLIEKLNRVTK